jgi:Flp pilus assembly protein CpaB
VRSVRLPLWARSRLLARARLVLAAVLLALAGLTAMSRAGPAAVEAGSVRVLVASRDLPGGAVLTAADVRPVTLPAAAVPAGALPPEETVAGRVLAGAVRRGEPLTDARVVGAGLARLAGGPGAAAVPVRLADPGVAALVRPGDRIDVVAVTESGQTSVIAAGVPVLAVPQAPETSPADGALIVLAVPEYLAPRLIAAALNARLAITLRPP